MKSVSSSSCGQQTAYRYYESRLGRANDPKRPLTPFTFLGRAARDAKPGPSGGANGYHRRIDGAMLQHEVSLFTEQPVFFICGPTQLVESVANELAEMGTPPTDIYTERSSSTGA